MIKIADEFWMWNPENSLYFHVAIPEGEGVFIDGAYLK